MPKSLVKHVYSDDMTAEIAKVKALVKPLEAHLAAQAAAKDARIALEIAFTAHMASKGQIPAGKEPKFGYNWGHIAVAWADQSEAKASKANKPQITL